MFSPVIRQSDIKEAYFRLAKLYHPDVNSDESARENFDQARFQSQMYLCVASFCTPGLGLLLANPNVLNYFKYYNLSPRVEVQHGKLF
jgi:hypothetical protein